MVSELLKEVGKEWGRSWQDTCMNTVIAKLTKPFNSQDLISNSPTVCLTILIMLVWRIWYQINDSHYVSLENLVSDQQVIPHSIFFFILIICLHDTVSI